MSEYLSPGVYMEEFEIGAKPIEGVSTSTAGFLGETERGPTTPHLITSWLQFQRVFGGYFGNDKYLPGAVDGFFKNGGARCYIARIVKSGDNGATSATLLLRSIDNIYIEESEKAEKEHNKVKEFKDKILTIKAVGEGSWGNRIAVVVSTGTFSGIKLNVFYWKTECPSIADINKENADLTKVLKKHPPTVIETFDNISLSETSSDYFEKTVNVISNLITVSINDLTNTSNAVDLSTKKNLSDFYLNDGVNSVSEKMNPSIAGLNLKNADKAPLSITALKNKILRLEAVKVGSWGNNVKITLSKESAEVKLVASYSETIKNFSIEKPTQSELIKILAVCATTENLEDAKDASKETLTDLPLTKGDIKTKASLKLKSVDQNPLSLTSLVDHVLRVEAVREGAWGNNIKITLSKESDGIKLISSYSETINNLSIEPPTSSEFIKISAPDATEENMKEAKDASTEALTNLPLVGGVDSIDTDVTKLLVADYSRTDSDIPGSRKGLTAFKEIEDISIIYAPNSYDVPGLVDEMISHCEQLRYRFVILDAKQGLSDVSNSDLDPRSGNPTDYAAFYYPWIKVINPETGLAQLMPPGGYVAGIYARSDTERGVHKAPANEVVRGASDLEFQIMKGEQDILNPRGVNVIRAFSGRGILVWGARTLSSNTLWKYINVRRLFIYVEASIERGTQWVVFEPNDERLWARVKATITQFLTGVWRSGALMGSTPEQAFFVKCDRSTMTQDDIDNGRLVCIIGIAPVKPAEFVIFRIAQWQGGSAATE